MVSDALLAHVARLTDDTAIVQHAVRDIPNRASGYCTDDVARGLIVAVECARRDSRGTVAPRLASTYLSFLHDAQLADGWFHNFMGYDRGWQDARGSADAFGRALWALGVTWNRSPRETWRDVARRLFDAALPNVRTVGALRPLAYAALGLCAALDADGADRFTLGRALRGCVEPIALAFAREAQPGWMWCEPLFTYDNARLPEALLRAGRALDDPRLVEAGVAMLAFYVGIVIEDDLFVPIGNDGWFVRGGQRARYGQQPLEAAALIDAVDAASAAGVQELPFARAARASMDWFFGANTVRTGLVVDGGCCDGIDVNGRNGNMGAESTLAYVQSALVMETAPAARVHALR